MIRLRVPEWRPSGYARVAWPSVALVCASWWLLVGDLARTERHERDEVHRQLEIVTVVGARAVQSALRSVDILLVDLREQWARAPASFESTARRRRLFADLGLDVDVDVVDADGRLRYTTDTDEKIGSFAGKRPIFLQLRDDADDAMVIGAPALDRAGRWRVPLARAIRAPGGRFDGIVVFEVPPEFFTHATRAVDFPPGSAVTVHLDDRTILVRATTPDGPAPEGSRIRVDYPVDAPTGEDPPK